MAENRWRRYVTFAALAVAALSTAASPLRAGSRSHPPRRRLIRSRGPCLAPDCFRTESWTVRPRGPIRLARAWLHALPNRHRSGHLDPGLFPDPPGAAERSALLSAMGLQPQPGTVNYLIGNDPANWHTGIATYDRVAYASVYPGIDLVYYGREGRHEYDFVVGPARPLPPLAFASAEPTSRVGRRSGRPLARDCPWSAYLRAPHVYQRAKADRPFIAARYVLDRSPDGVVGFDRRTLRSQPAAGHRSADCLRHISRRHGQRRGPGEGRSISDATGAPFVVGASDQRDFPVRLADATAVQSGGEAGRHEALARRRQRVYSTYIGGSSYDGGRDIAVRVDGTAYVVGSTFSDDFPVRSAAFQRSAPATPMYSFVWR